MAAADAALSSQRVFKKSSPNNKLTLYLSSRDLTVARGRVDKLRGVLHVDPEFLEHKKVFGQVTLTFRYGREDEEVMGLKFCNEAIMCLAQIWPPHPGQIREQNTPLQDALIRRLGVHAHAFTLELTPLAPPSVQLVPAKEYHGAPIGTSYDVRAYVADRADEKLIRRNTVRMGIRVVQGAGGVAVGAGGSVGAAPPARPRLLGELARVCAQRGADQRQGASSRDTKILRFSPKWNKLTSEKSASTEEDNCDRTICKLAGQELEPLLDPDSHPPPHASVEKPFLLSDGRVELEAALDRAVYAHGEPVHVSVLVNNNSQKTVRRIKCLIVQHVDVCMFSNGKFKNAVAVTSSGRECPVSPGARLATNYTLHPQRGQCVTKNWIALEDSYSKMGASLASTVLCNSYSADDRNVFAIYVSYYVKVKLALSSMGGELSVKLPFILTHSCTSAADTLAEDYSPKQSQPLTMSVDEEEESRDDTEPATIEKPNLYQLTEKPETNSVNEASQATSPFDELKTGLTDVIINIDNKTNAEADNDTIEESKDQFGDMKNKVHKTEHTEEDMNLIVSYESDDT